MSDSTGTPTTGTPPIRTASAGIANTFVNPQTAISLPVASGAITMTWRISGTLYTPLGQTPWIPVVLSVLVGIAFYIASDPIHGKWRDKIPFILAAFFNTVTLAASVLGFSAAITGG
ncbi:MAG: hypothetical protein FVQ84_14915 [Planctomycetes bacterium]|nr:hypothetical protein [Planctomycetota bacterium]